MAVAPTQGDSLKTRTLVGACLVAAITGLLAADRWTGHGYGVVVLATALTGAGLYEYASMVGPRVPLAAGPLMAAGMAYTALRGLGYELDARLHAATVPFVIACLYALFFAALRGAPSVARFQGLCAAVFGFVYLPWLGGFALDARFLAAPLGEPAFYYVVAIAKGTDIFAYYSGKLLGRTKLVPSVSPGKTTAGFVGAVAGGVVITWLFARFTALGEALPLPLVPGVGIVLALVVIAGDLIESFLKRAVDVKDSARLLPGFGGVLDVIDSVVVVAPAVYLTLLYLPRLVR